MHQPLLCALCLITAYGMAGEGPSGFCTAQNSSRAVSHEQTSSPIKKGRHDSKKGGHTGGLSVCAKAALTMPQETTIVIDPLSTSHPFSVVPLTPSSVNEHIGFDLSKNAFVIHKDGTYIAEFYLKLWSNSSRRTSSLAAVANTATIRSGQVVVALRRTHEGKVSFLSSTKFVPVVTTLLDNRPDAAYGTHHELLKLDKDDELQFVITDLPGPTPWYYFGGLPPETDEVAYLTLINVSG